MGNKSEAISTRSSSCNRWTSTICSGRATESPRIVLGNKISIDLFILISNSSSRSSHCCVSRGVLGVVGVNSLGDSGCGGAGVVVIVFFLLLKGSICLESSIKWQHQ